MIDIHCHILPDLDDGPRTASDSIAMGRIASDDGITHIVATPHYTHGEPPTREEIAQRLQDFRAQVAAEGVAVEVLGGADIKLTYELLSGIERDLVPTINGSRYFLVELPNLMPPNMEHVLFSSGLHGMVPIVTHPERNFTLASSPKKARALRESGFLFQVTAMSLTGEFGAGARQCVRAMLKAGLVDFVASDAHGPDGRRPVLSRAFKEVVSLCGKHEAGKIFFDNAEAVIEDREAAW